MGNSRFRLKSIKNEPWKDPKLPRIHISAKTGKQCGALAKDMCPTCGWKEDPNKKYPEARRALVALIRYTLEAKPSSELETVKLLATGALEAYDKEGRDFADVMEGLFADADTNEQR